MPTITTGQKTSGCFTVTTLRETGLNSSVQRLRARGSPITGATLRTEDGVIVLTEVVDAQVKNKYLSSLLPQFGKNPNSEILFGGRYRIRTYDFHRVKMALYR